MKKLKSLLKQIFKFGIVGVICFVIDYGLMIFLTDAVHINYLVSCAVAFVISTIVNYCFSMKFVFKAVNDMNKTTEVSVFVIMSVIGLLLTELLMLLFVEKFYIHYAISKVIATIIVMCYNFITRKILFETERK